MQRKMLINAKSPEELRLAIVADSNLEEYQVDVAERGQTRGNVYRGVIANIQPSLNAAFVDYGCERHGFLAIQDVVPQAYYKKPKARPKIEEVLERGRSIVVQVTKEPEGQKGAVLTTNLSFAGRYLVFTPFEETRGISRKVEDEEMRKDLKAKAASLDVPKGSGIIVRTNGIGQNKTTLGRDLSALLRLWKRVGTEARRGKGPKLVYSDQDIVLQALRDYLDPSIEEVLVDADGAYERAAEYMRAFMPRSKTQLIRYTDRTPLFSHFHLEPQIDRIYQRVALLPSGGSIVIDRTEALTAVDVNSGKSTRSSSQEETALSTNLEAAAEVARQLRMRDIGGLVVVDFIDMRAQKNRRKIEKALKDSMKPDKARHSVGRISDNGLLEVNRQRINQELRIRTHRPCTTCDGTGHIPSPEFVGLNLLRRIAARASSEPVKRVRVRLHPEVADAVQNGRRRELAELEAEFDLRIELVSSPTLHRAEQHVDWLRGSASEDRPVAAPVASIRVGDVARSTRAPRVEAPPGDEPDEAGAEEEVEAAEPERRGRRRRRRRGRGRRAEGQAPDGNGQEAGAAGEAESASTEPSGGATPNGEATESGGATEGGGRPRRRRGRRGGGGGGGNGDQAEASPAPDGPGDAPGHGVAAEGGSAEPSRGRARTEASEGANGTVSTEDAAADGAPAGPDEGEEAGAEGGGRPRRRRRRRRPRRTEEAPTS